MVEDNWKDYKKFKQSKPDVEAYYDLVKTVFFEGVEQVAKVSTFLHALDLGCGSGEFTRDLLKYARKVTGVDSSPEQIRLAQQDAGKQGLKFIESDVLNPDLFNSLEEKKFDLVTATWLHNHLLDEEDHHTLLKILLELITPEGSIVFLIPSSAFTSLRTQSFIEKLGWRQAWLRESYHCSRGVYSFMNSDWAEMNVWQPMWLAHLYSTYFSVHFLDVKAISLAHGGLGDNMIEPPFDVLYGQRL